VQCLLNEAPCAKAAGARSIRYAHTDAEQRLPFWVLTFWLEVHALLNSQRKWSRAETFLTKRESNLVACTFRASLDRLCWSDSTRGFSDFAPIHDLANFASREWLSDTNLNMMLDIIDGAGKDAVSNHVFQQTYFVAVLLIAYQERAKGTYLSSRETQCLRTAADGLFQGCYETLGFPCNINGNHWTALVVSATDHKVRYRDSLGAAVPDSLKDAVNWWLSHHTHTPLDWDTLDITSQEDPYSCGLFAINALSHYILPSKFPLLSPLLHDTDTARVHFGNMIIERHVSLSIRVSITFLCLISACFAAIRACTSRVSVDAKTAVAAIIATGTGITVTITITVTATFSSTFSCTTH